MFFKVNCYIIKIINNTLYIEILDKDELERFKKNLLKLYKSDNNFKNTKKYYIIKINKQTKFNINYNYNNISELIGINVTISGYSKYYSFLYNDEILDIHNNLKTITKNKKGYSLYANKIIL